MNFALFRILQRDLIKYHSKNYELLCHHEINSDILQIFDHLRVFQTQLLKHKIFYILLTK
ncbi:hypothetical protein BpHYR1_052493 [Brachionus plicatilis]|uniref:Uncharacterized protein n=1 Tax=Brachionus plicatilis TaxID=10195 RepID=A0A3M7R949_BRAPC|nr:hypothetical protein BpHYR1_052493 [Brachionus plicatilis]